MKELTDLDIPDHAKCDFSETTIMKFYFEVDLTNEKCLWTGGTYNFKIEIANDYPYTPPKCTCLT